MKASSFWSFILRRLAKAQGFLDPIVVFSRLQRFAQPAEVWVPTELLRSSAILQARGLINSQAIQHNLDWIWPFWVGRQFDPADSAFIPRAFSMTHINLTHRNWTAIGLPDLSCLPIVDPRGLVTPFFDGWSIDGWIMSENAQLIPSRLTDVQQTIDLNNTVAVSTHCRSNALTMDSRADVRMEAGVPVCRIVFKALAPCPAWLAVSPRPYNPEGVSFIHDIHIFPDEKGWSIDQKHEVHLSDQPAACLFSDYLSGDIGEQILSFMAVNAFKAPAPAVACPVGMASAAALYELEPHRPREIVVKIPLAKKEETAPATWASHLEDHCRITIPDQKFQFLYEAALRTLILHSPGDVYPGPFTYKRFWFRDAAFIINAMVTTGLVRNIERILDRFPSRQKASGYFMSQDGEWDSNGQAIWIIHRVAAMTHTPVKPKWLSSIYQGARWIQWKRLSSKHPEVHAGLMPAGFSAEHFGPSDFYYWDDFWSAAGLRAAASLALADSPDLVRRFKTEADDLLLSVEKSLQIARKRLNCAGVPASPYRRMDGGPSVLWCRVILCSYGRRRTRGS